jgi:hypothetical protein
MENELLLHDMLDMLDFLNFGWFFGRRGKICKYVHINLGFLMKLPQAAVLSTSGITKILHRTMKFVEHKSLVKQFQSLFE